MSDSNKKANRKTVTAGAGGIAVGGDVGGDITITNQIATPIAYSLHQLPSPEADFVGRQDELDELLKQAKEKGAHISGLRGQGGVGKTALAVVFAHAIRHQYPEAQLFIDLKGAGDQPLTPRDVLENFLRAFYPPDTKFPDDEAALHNAYLTILHDKRAIVVLDNAKDSAQIKLLVPPPSCFLLVTSRFHFALPGLHPINLEILSAKDSIELLEKICPRLDSPLPRNATGEAKEHRHAGEGLGVRAVDDIANLCGYLPLALRAAASLLEVNHNIDPAHYVAQLRDERTRLEKLGAEGVDISVEASLNLSYAPLDDETKRVFRSLSVFPADFKASAEESIGDDVEHQHLSDLMRRSLVIYEDDTKRYRLHDLARLFADTRMSDEERFNGQLKFAMHYESVLRSAKEFYKRGGDSIRQGLNLFDTERINVEHGRAWAVKNLEKRDEVAQLVNLFPDAGVYVLDLRLHPREKIRWMEDALKAARQLKNRSYEGAHLGNLGLAYADLGETRKAIEYYEQALVIDREIGDRHGEGNALGNLGLAYADLGETRKAIEYYEQQLKIAREIGDRRGEGAALGNLGNAYAVLGETRKAIEYYEQQLKIVREIGDRRGEGNALMNTGNAHFSLELISKLHICANK